METFCGYCDDTSEQGTKYNGSGCLIHGLTVVADSFLAIDRLLAERPEDAELLLRALQNNFEGYEELQDFLLSAPKFGNNIPAVDEETALIATKIADMVAGSQNYLGNPFRPDLNSTTFQKVSPASSAQQERWGVLEECDRKKARDLGQKENT